MRSLLATTVLILFCVAASATENGSRVFATVGDVEVSVEEFEANFHAGARQRFYHGSVPAEDLEAFRHEVAEEMIDRILLLQEADRRGIVPDKDWMEKEMAQYADRIATSAEPERARALVRAQLSGDSVIARLKAQVEAIPEIDEDQVRAWYRANPELFTTPERARVSLILLKVEPWASGEQWEAAFLEAQRIHQRLENGSDFAALARLHSADGSAAQGGDLGYVHRGMLSSDAQQVVDKMSPGEISEPVHLLQGFAIFRLEARTEPELNAFDQVAERARGLLRRELQEQARARLLRDLRDKTRIEINRAVLDTGE